ncbi:MAG TPA: acyltransferase [Verrucomicrobiae bacterium]|jgi:peptidoglycan/LPS O-acetylase OafA/YrhL
MAGKSSYLRQLDGLRALSVAAVAWSHWSDQWYSNLSIPYAELGVNTFFVISGFLITGILLDNRSETDRSFIFRQFYARRILRIFPLFYAVLVVGLILNANTVRQYWYWHVTYLSNILFYLHGWQAQTSHFWSLAVEEQFYLCWPLLIIFLPKRFILPVILAAIVGAPLFETGMNVFYIRHSPYLTASVLAPSCMDSLGIGALLAYGVRQKYPMKYLAYGLLMIGLIGCAIWRWSYFAITWEPFFRLGENCILGWLVFSSAQGFRGPVGWLLESAPMNFLGKISYGLYIIHNFAISLWRGLIALLGNPSWLARIHAMPAQIFIFTFITVGLASLSWYVLEKPIINLKRKFPYPRNPQTSWSNQPEKGRKGISSE